MDRRGFRPAVYGRDLNANIVGIGLCIFDKKIKIAVFVKNAGVDEFEFIVGFCPACVLFVKQFIGRFGLRVFVEVFHMGMRRRVVQIVIAFLYVFAVIALRPAQAEEAFLEDRIVSVTKRYGKA